MGDTSPAFRTGGEQAPTGRDNVIATAQIPCNEPYLTCGVGAPCKRQRELAIPRDDVFLRASLCQPASPR